MNSSKSIVIVGGGASATLLLAELILQVNTNEFSPTAIYIIDDSNLSDNSSSNKGGIAYQVQHPSFLLNVAANQMGAYNDKPDHFFQWLIKYPKLWRNLHTDFNTIEFRPNDFVPRMIYAAYLRWVFDDAKNLAHSKNISVHVVTARVMQVNAIEEKLHIITNSHAPFVADTLIFATGNIIKKHQDLIGPHIFSSPYCQEFIQQDWRSIENIIIVGSGLSMIDAVQYLEQQHYKGNIQVFSRHGLIPLPHSTELKSGGTSEVSPSVSSINLNTARKIVSSLREQLKTNTNHGISWQKTINEFRKQVASIWLSLSIAEQNKLGKALPWWNIARHRIPANVHENIRKLQQEGRLIITKGDINKARSDGEYFLLDLNQKTLFVKSEKLLICSGYKGSYDNLLQICGNLLPPKEHLKKSFDCNRLRLSTDYPIYAIGPALAEILFETTAIHEIRQQSHIIASEITFKERLIPVAKKSI